MSKRVHVSRPGPKKNSDILVTVFWGFRRSPLLARAPGLSKNGELVQCGLPQQEGSLPPELRVVGKLGYIRFHGRDPGAWYNYAYSEDELRSWVDQIKSLRERPEKIYVFFNNGVEVRAVENAVTMKELLKRLYEHDGG